MNIGSSNKQIYDNCNYQKRLYESTSPLNYRLYEGQYENCGKCKYNKFWRPFDLVDIESELRNQTRPLSDCDQFKYNPNCTKSKSCISTFDSSVPVVLDSSVCPIVYNNIPKTRNTGIRVPRQTYCNQQVGPYAVNQEA